jgi:hypothetical protein
MLPSAMDGFLMGRHCALSIASCRRRPRYGSGRNSGVASVGDTAVRAQRGALGHGSSARLLPPLLILDYLCINVGNVGLTMNERLGSSAAVSGFGGGVIN